MSELTIYPHQVLLTISRAAINTFIEEHGGAVVSLTTAEEDWCKDQCTGAWSVHRIPSRQLAMTVPVKSMFTFENERDATLFKTFNEVNR